MSNAEVFFFQMLKGGVDKRTRDMMGASIAATLNRSWPLPRTTPTPEEDATVRRLEQKGFAEIPPMFSSAELDEIHAYFADKPICFTNQDLTPDDGSRALLNARPPGLRFGLWDQNVISACPAFCRAAFDPGLLRVAEAYLGAPPTVSILTAWWSFPADAPRGGMQNYHHDRDDFRMLKVFCYLTDTTVTSGPHEFIDETHSFEALLGFMSRRQWSSAAEQKKFLEWMEVHRKDDGDVARIFPKENIRTITGKRGSSFFEDTRGLHRGLPPVSEPRLAFEICYALTPKYNYTYAPVPRPCAVGSDPAATYANRLIYQDAVG
ncbi:MAG: hypothetical protein K1X51_07095 [Rhodospirillaceae bacterium]|nr:hypothetical protein [Rhodospirillaceae bacterium]